MLNCTLLKIELGAKSKGDEAESITLQLPVLVNTMPLKKNDEVVVYRKAAEKKHVAKRALSLDIKGSKKIARWVQGTTAL